MSKRLDLFIDQGTTYSNTVTLTDGNNNPIDITSYANGQSLIKKWYTSQNLVPFSVSINTGSSSVTLSLTSNATANIKSGRYVYDVDLLSNTGTVTKVLEGIVTINPSVTAGIFSTNNTWWANGYTDG